MTIPLSRKTLGWSLGIVAAGIATGVMAAPHVTLPRIIADALPVIEARDVGEALQARLPKTRIDKVICGSIGALCEINAGGTLFYVDKTARYLLVGRIYDMETRQDLTAARLLELNPDLIAAGGVKLAAHDTPEPALAITPQSHRVSLAGLSGNGAIHWGPQTGAKVIVLSDFHCSYCKKLEGELEKVGARVEERPISIFGKESRALAEAVICSDNPAAALKSAYQGQAPNKSRACDTSGLDANEAFARKHNVSGTPVLIRADGTMLEGYRPASVIAAFLKAGRASAADEER